MKSLEKRYVVSDVNGAYQSAYNCALGEETALKYAKECAKTINGKVHLVDSAEGYSVEVFSAQN